MNFARFANIKKSIDSDKANIEYIMHKLFSNPDCQYAEYDKETCVWDYPECWLARYFLYYELHRQIITNSTILDIGANLNLYSRWAITNGARTVDGFEPNAARFALGQEYLKITQMNSNIVITNESIDSFFNNYSGKKYDVVFFLDVFYYLTNGVDVLTFIKEKIKPKFLFFESTVINDTNNNGHFDLWYPAADPKAMQSYKDTIGLVPSRNALKNIINHMGWKVVTYYDYKDFVGRGESLPRNTGNKDFYLLENNDN